MIAGISAGVADASMFAGVAACEAICDILNCVAWLDLISTFGVGRTGGTNCVPWVDSWDGLQQKGDMVSVFLNLSTSWKATSWKSR